MVMGILCQVVWRWVGVWGCVVCCGCVPVCECGGVCVCVCVCSFVWVLVSLGGCELGWSQVLRQVAVKLCGLVGCGCSQQYRWGVGVSVYWRVCCVEVGWSDWRVFWVRRKEGVS